PTSGRSVPRNREAAGGRATHRDRAGEATEAGLRSRAAAPHAQGDVSMASKKRRATTDAVEILHRRYIAGRPDQEAALENARLNAAIAREIYDLRTKAGLTQKQLAALCETAHSVFSRPEDADYYSLTLPTLQR